MSKTPDKQKIRRSRHIYQFVSPYSLEECRTRLENKSQRAEVGFWKNMTRIWIRTWDHDADTARFDVRILPKGLWTLQILRPDIQVGGKLYRQADGTTAVEMYARNNEFLLFGYYLGLACLLLLAIIVFSLLRVPMGAPAILVLWSFFALIFALMPIYRLLNSSYAPLVETVEKALKP